ncbi:MAG TPA: helix-turn-helix domain-containing protein [Candidatus Andersenbacteria bacterium]|nr:helix-turn-helix domain-containing protein [Candidatus Andersenbacteria bacterium]
MLSKIQKEVALELVTGTSQREAARQHQLHYMTVQSWKRKEEFITEIERLREMFFKAAAQAEKEAVCK